MRSCGLLILLVVAPATFGCVGTTESSMPGAGGQGGGDAGALVIPGCDAGAPPSRFISCVKAFTPGDGAGTGQDRFPEVIYGPPKGIGPKFGSLDVLSLGKHGEIVVGFGGNSIVDGDGPDFIVFENAFVLGGNPKNVFQEVGDVSVSQDGVAWTAFPCQRGAYPYTGCAGWHTVLSNPDNGISPFGVTKAGGDAFDLADLGVKNARFVRIRDLSDYGGAPNAGFDLDAMAIVNPQFL